ncbi:MAG: hypothetical protein AB1861_30795, partial [Cyanobacteriota bacterium]
MTDTNGMLEVTLADARQIMEKVWSINPKHAFVLFGPSGVGKSTMVAGMVGKNEGFFPLYGHSFNPTEINGILYVDEKTGLAKWAKLGCLPLPEERGDPESGIICVEEPNHAPPAIQGELQKLIYGRISGDYRVPDKYKVVGCANRTKDRANINPMPGPLRVRWTWLWIRPDVEVWVRDFALPHKINWSIVGFLRFRPDAFNEDPPLDGPFACGRTWERVNDYIEAGLPDILNDLGEAKLFRAAVYGAVGGRFGSEYLAYRNIADRLPS